MDKKLAPRLATQAENSRHRVSCQPFCGLGMLVGFTGRPRVGAGLRLEQAKLSEADMAQSAR